MNISQLTNICLSHSAVSARILLLLYTLWINSACSSTNASCCGLVFFPSPMWVNHHRLRTVNGIESTCLSRCKDLSSLHMAKLCWAPQSVPLIFAFPDCIPGEHVTPYKDIKQIFHHWREAKMFTSTVWYRYLVEASRWLRSLEDPATSTRSLRNFSILQTCAMPQSRLSQQGSTVGTICKTLLGPFL